ncbi:hypothetical protein C7C45_18315 [Micromonospora arborensis]|uniref:Uncharacterized protein n=1 Tax=Micromonospora arborensis TaxID=2116518 RepID=A0A318NHH6_9ACTN|nr:hypothetical protein C7C45_18315 [Micromonospora arborensis]
MEFGTERDTTHDDPLVVVGCRRRAPLSDSRIRPPRQPIPQITNGDQRAAAIGAEPRKGRITRR